MTIAPVYLILAAFVAGVVVARLWLYEKHKAADATYELAREAWRVAIRAETQATARLRSLPAREQFDGDRR